MRGKLLLLTAFAGAAASSHAMDLNVSETLFGANVNFTLNGYDQCLFAGELCITSDHSDGHDGDGHDDGNGDCYHNHDGCIIAFCTDAKHEAGDGSFDKLDTTSLGNANADKVGFLVNTYGPGVSDAEHGVALQLAIWEVLYDQPTFDVTGGNFKVNSIKGFDDTMTADTIALADSWANSAGSDTAVYWQPGKHDGYYDDEEHKKQSMVTPVPEPASVSALALGLLALIRRRKSASG